MYVLPVMIKLIVMCMQACEGGWVELAEELAARFPDTLNVRDKRGCLPRDLVANWNELWTHALGTRAEIDTKH